MIDTTLAGVYWLTPLPWTMSNRYVTCCAGRYRRSQGRLFAKARVCAGGKVITELPRHGMRRSGRTATRRGAATSSRFADRRTEEGAVRRCGNAERLAGADGAEDITHLTMPPQWVLAQNRVDTPNQVRQIRLINLRDKFMALLHVICRNRHTHLAAAVLHSDLGRQIGFHRFQLRLTGKSRIELLG